MKKSTRLVHSVLRFVCVTALLLFTTPLFMSCSSELGAGHTIRVPLFSNSFGRSLEPEGEYTYAIPPIVGWESIPLPSDADTQDFEILGATLSCRVDIQEDKVVFSGANETIDLQFTVFDDDSFSYTASILSRTSEDSIIAIESTIEEVSIVGNFISGSNGVAKAWEVDPSQSKGRFMSLTYRVSSEEQTPSFTLETLTMNSFDESFYVDTISLETWDTKRTEIDDELSSETPITNPKTYTLNDLGLWESD